MASTPEEIPPQFSDLSAKERQLMEEFHRNPVQWQHDLAKKLGWKSSHVTIRIPNIARKLRQRGYPNPFRKSRIGFFNRLALTPEYMERAGIPLTTALETHFRPRLAGAIRVLAENPGINRRKLAKRLGVSSTKAERMVAEMLGVVRADSLPPIYHLKRLGIIVSPQFSERFALPSTRDVISPFLGEEARRVLEYKRAHPNASYWQTATALRVDPARARHHFYTIRRIVSATHTPHSPQFPISDALLSYVPNHFGFLRFDGRWQIPHGVNRNPALSRALLWTAEIRRILGGNHEERLQDAVRTRLKRSYPIELIESAQRHLETELGHQDQVGRPNLKKRSQIVHELDLLQQYLQAK